MKVVQRTLPPAVTRRLATLHQQMQTAQSLYSTATSIALEMLGFDPSLAVTINLETGLVVPPDVDSENKAS